jgi:regulator of ribonuclease activity A
MTPTAEIVDRYAGSGLIKVCLLAFRSYGARNAFFGPAQTVRCHQDNALLKQTIAQPSNGGVVVVDGGSSLGTALCGDRVAAEAAANGWAGLLIAGAVRDVTTLQTVDIGIFALGSNPWPPGKTGAGEINHSLQLGDAEIGPGCWVYADEDGVLVAREELDLG